MASTDQFWRRKQKSEVIFLFMRVLLNFDFFVSFYSFFVFDALLSGGGAQHTAMVGGQGQNRF